MKEKSTLYSFAVIAQPIISERGQFYLWQKIGKYKKIEHAEKALVDRINTKISTLVYKIVPYFDGYWYVDEETKKREFIITNISLWEFLNKKGLKEEALEFILSKKNKNKKWIFF